MWNVRLASPADRDEVLRLARGLLVELGGNPAPAEELHWLFDELVADNGIGFAVIAEEDGEAKAVCTASFQMAIRTAGKYCILQEMFVEPESRSSRAWARPLSTSRCSMPWTTAAKWWSWARPVTVSSPSSSTSGRGLRISAPACGGDPRITGTGKSNDRTKRFRRCLPVGGSNYRIPGSRFRGDPLRVSAGLGLKRFLR